MASPCTLLIAILVPLLTSASSIKICRGAKYLLGGSGPTYSRFFEGQDLTIAGGGSVIKNIALPRCAKLCGGCIGFSWNSITHECKIFKGISLGGVASAPQTIHTYGRFHGFFLVNHKDPLELTWPEARQACLDEGGDLSEFHTHAHQSHVLLWQTVRVIGTFIGVYLQGSEYRRLPLNDPFPDIDASLQPAENIYAIFDGGHKTISDTVRYALPCLCWKP